MSGVDLNPDAARRLLGGLLPAGTDDAGALDRWATVVWCHLVEPGDSAAGRAVQQLGATAALRAVLDDGPVADLDGQEIAAARKRWLPRVQLDPIRDGLHRAAKAGVSLVTRSDAQWPRQLDDLSVHAPICLWVRGDATALARLRPSVAIVGARAATSYGDHVALELSADLAGFGLPVVSGGAYGIDGAAHRAALEVGGLTVALLAGGVDKAYPAGHTGLIERVVATGAVVSEVPCGSAPTKWRFLQRNRLIAALTDATIVVEAGWRSGSLNTAGHAAALSRRLGAVPGPITSAASAGSHRLLREFGASCITSAADVRELLGLGGAIDLAGSGAGEHGETDRPRTDHSTRIRDALSARVWRVSDDISRRSGMAVDDVEVVLGVLSLDGTVQRGPGGWRLTPSSG